MQQLWNVLGPEGSKYVVWLTIAVGLVLAVLFILWIGSRVFGRGLNFSSGGRGQHLQRLGITGAFNVDRKGRKLVIVRRDNIEHLILIGGPNDVLVESNIVRAAERGGARQNASQPTIHDSTAVTVALPGQQTTTPPQPAPAPTVLTAAVAVPLQPLRPAGATTQPPSAPVNAAPRLQPQPQVSPRVIEQPVEPIVSPVAAQVPPPQVAPVPAPIAAPAPRIPAPEPQPSEPQAPAQRVAAPAPQTLPQQAPAPQTPTPKPSAPQPRATAPDPVETARPAADARLSDMARRLQSVLKQPLTPVPPPRTPDPVAAAKAENIPIPLPSRLSEPKSEQPPQVPQGKAVPVSPARVDTSAVDSLEEEMARLLGRPGPDRR